MNTSQSLVVAVAVLVLACTSRAQQVATVTWVNQAVNYDIPGTQQYHNYFYFSCSALGLMMTSANGTTLATSQSGFGVYPYTYVSDTGSYFCPNYVTALQCCNPSMATVGLPLSAFQPGWPEFIGEGMSMKWGGYQAGTNPAFPTADTYNITTLATADGAWTGSTTQWFQSFIVPRRCLGRICAYNVTEYKAVGGTGTLTAVLP